MKIRSEMSAPDEIETGEPRRLERLGLSSPSASSGSSPGKLNDDIDAAESSITGGGYMGKGEGSGGGGGRAEASKEETETRKEGER